MLQKYFLVNQLLIKTIKLPRARLLEKTLTYPTFKRALTPGSKGTTGSDSSPNSTEFGTKRGVEDSGNIFRFLPNSVSQLNIVLFGIMK